MAIKISMPKLSDTMKEGKLIKWHKNEGADVNPGDILAEVETDKANMDLEIFDKGTLLKRLVKENDKVPVGTVLAVIGDKKENIDAILKEISSMPPTAAAAEKKHSPGSAPASSSPAKAVSPAPSVSPVRESARPAVPSSPQPAVSSSGIRVSPVAAALAAEHGIPLDSLQGSGPEGRIIKRDIETVLAQGWTTARLPSRGRAAAAPGTVRIENQLAESLVPLEGMRKVIADRMSQAKQTIPHFYLQDAIRMDRIHALRESLNSRDGVRYSFNDFILMGVCRALMMNPAMNATFDGVGIHLHASVDIGFAVAIEGGLITPILRQAERGTLRQLHEAAEALAARARDRKLKPDEYMGGSFTVSNLGMYGLDNFLPIINPPQVAILAVGGIKQQPCVDDEGHFYAGRQMGVTIACDHRALDGAVGAKFLGDLKTVLEHPEGWSA